MGATPGCSLYPPAALRSVELVHGWHVSPLSAHASPSGKEVAPPPSPLDPLPSLLFLFFPRYNGGTINTGKSHYPQARTRDRVDSQSTAPESSYAGESSSIPGSIGSNTTGGSVGHGGSAAAVGGTTVYGYGAGGADGGRGSGWRRRNFVGSAGAAVRAGYGFVVTTDLEPGIGGDRRALWTCFCSFKTRRKRCCLSCVPASCVADHWPAALVWVLHIVLLNMYIWLQRFGFLVGCDGSFAAVVGLHT